MFQWLPLVGHLYPGLGITPWSVLNLSLEWWLIVAQQAKAYHLESEKQVREARRGK